MKEKILFVSSSISFHENFLLETINSLAQSNDIYVIANCKFKTKNFKNINLINIPISRKINILSDFICTLLLVKNLNTNKTYNLLLLFIIIIIIINTFS